MTPTEIEEIRQAVANYMRSEGCSCCRDLDAHKEHKTRLATLLQVPEHPEEKGYYDFSKYDSYPKD